MSEYKFEGLLEYLCGDILSKAERKEVRDELYDHLMTRYEINLACGMTEDEAEYDAVDHLGDTLALKKDLNKVHQKNPLKNLFGAFSNILVFTVLTFACQYTEYFNRFRFVIFAVCIGFIIASAISIRKISGLFRALSAVLLIYSLTMIGYDFISLCVSPVFSVMTAVLIAEIILIIFLLHFAVEGLLKTHNLEMKNKRLLVLSLAVSSICFVLYGFLYLFLEKGDSFLRLFWLVIIFVGGKYLKSADDILEKNDVKPDFGISPYKKALAVLQQSRSTSKS